MDSRRIRASLECSWHGVQDKTFFLVEKVLCYVFLGNVVS